jgi:hypothetical protein
MSEATFHGLQVSVMASILFLINAQCLQLCADEKPTEISDVISDVDALARTIAVQVGPDTSVSAGIAAVEAKADAPQSPARLRIVIELSSSGAGKLILGRPGDVPGDMPEGKPTKLSFFPNAETLLRNDGSHAITYDFRKGKAIDELVDEKDELRLDNSKGLLVIMPAAHGFAGFSPTAKCRIRLPLRMSFDIDRFEKDGLFEVSIKHSGRVVNAFRFEKPDDLESSIHLSATSYTTHRRMKHLIPSQTVKLSTPAQISFAIPDGWLSHDDRYSIDCLNADAPLSLSRWFLSASIVPDFGLKLYSEGQSVFFNMIGIPSNGIAAQAGIKPYDRLLSIDGVKVLSESAARRQLDGHRHGETCTLVLKRRDKELTVRMKAE